MTKPAFKTSIIMTLPLLLGVSCQPQTSVSIPGQTMPTPPFQELVDQRILLDSSERILCQCSTIDETVASIQRIQARPDRGRYRLALEELSSNLFQQIASSGDPENVIMTLLATTACHHPLSPSLSRKLLHSDNPMIQLSAVQTLSCLNTSEADDILIDALRSDYPAIRLEAAWRLSCKRTKDAFFHIDALCYKLPQQFRAYLPELFAVEGSAASILRLKQFLVDPDEQIIITALVASGLHHIDAVGDILLTMSSHSPAHLEALAFALRIVDSEEARIKLKKLADNEYPCVRLQAALSLISLGDSSYLSTIQDLANNGDLFAINALGDIQSHSLLPLLTQPSRTVRLNTALSMLAQKDPECVDHITSLISMSSDEVLLPSRSVGLSLTCWDIAPIEAFDPELQPMVREQVLSIKESLLIQSLELNDSSFQKIAQTTFSEQNVDLFPCLIQLLENQRSDNTVSLLCKESQRLGSPYNRAFATLALVRLGIERNESVLRDVLDFSRASTEQSWRTPLPWFLLPQTDDGSRQQQAATAARLYMETIQTLADCSSPTAIDILSEELSKAPKKYLPIVTACLLQATL